ncbi:hypothetical protein MMC07_003949 [Pseudocyphellaria aurata]|nr:hypothetical protein [Pseudocyphellaria aurata]
MPNKKSVFAGGWNQTKADQLNKVQVPAKIRCSVCKKVKVAETYSKKQLGDLKHHIALGNDVKHANIRCRICTGSQVHEMTCAHCNVTKSLEGFSKAQRRTPDSARCYECLNQTLATRPGIKNEWEDSSDDDDSEYDSDEVTNIYESQVRTISLPYIILHADLPDQASDIDGVTASMQMLTAQNLEYHAGSDHPKTEASVGETKISSVVSNKDKMPARSTPGTTNAWNTYAQANSKRATEFTGYDSAGVAHRRVRAPSTVASDDYRSARAPWDSKYGKAKVCNALQVSHHKPVKSHPCI